MRWCRNAQRRLSRGVPIVTEPSAVAPDAKVNLVNGPNPRIKKRCPYEYTDRLRFSAKSTLESGAFHPSESVGKFRTCLSLCILGVLCVAVVSVFTKFTTEAQSSQSSHRGLRLFRQTPAGLSGKAAAAYRCIEYKL